MAAGRILLGATGPLRAQKNLQIWQIGGNPLQNFGHQGPGMADTGLQHPHPPTRLDVLHTHLLPHTAPSLIPPHPLAHPVSSQGSGSPKGRGGKQARAAPVTQSAPATGLAALGLTESAVHALAVDLQGVVANGVAAALPSPAPAGPMAKVATLSLLHLHFVCGVAADVDLPPIWESVA